MAKKIVAALIGFVLLFSVMVSADQIQIDPKFSLTQYNSLIGFTDMISGNCLEKQYTYGGAYNPLILACESAVRWVEGLATVRYDLGQEFPAGTTFQISCGGWYNKNYSFTSVNMYASSVCPVSEDSYWEFVASRSALDPVSDDGAIQTTNGQYKARLYNGSYTLPLKSRYIYLVFDIYLSSARNGGVYLGVSCGSISYEGNPDTEANANNKGGGAVDTVMEAINLNVDVYGGALNSLVSAVSYSGTDAVLPIPAIKIPAFDVTGGEIELLSAQSYDFSEAINMVPASIMLLVRSLLTAALIWFSVKELVGYIQYFLTLRGGGVDE